MEEQIAAYNRAYLLVLVPIGEKAIPGVGLSHLVKSGCITGANLVEDCVANMSRVLNVTEETAENLLGESRMRLLATQIDSVKDTPGFIRMLSSALGRPVSYIGDVNPFFNCLRGNKTILVESQSTAAPAHESETERMLEHIPGKTVFTFPDESEVSTTTGQSVGDRPAEPNVKTEAFANQFSSGLMETKAQADPVEKWSQMRVQMLKERTKEKLSALLKSSKKWLRTVNRKHWFQNVPDSL